MKKKQPIDSLTEQDKYTIRKYIYLKNNCKCGPFDIVLQEWNKSKRRLYHAMGNKLRIRKRISLKKDNITLERKLSDVYTYHPIYYVNDINTFKETLISDNIINFYNDFLIYVFNLQNISPSEKMFIANLFKYKYIIEGYISNKADFKLKEYSFSVQNGAKTMRTIQKCVKALKYPNIELFNKWRNSINTINSNNLTSFDMVISIHPIDFITMSDNTCNWTSCMSWEKGCYSAGTIEMMNSNVAAVAYIESEKPYTIILDSEHQITIPNKSWRSLLFCNKNIILAGKSYPYAQENISKEVIKFMREIVKKTVHWDYKFKEQKYQDIKHYYRNGFLKYSCNPTYNNHKKIIIYTNGMYNDFIEDRDCDYWCARNLTKGFKLSLSGKVTCMCCGKPMYYPWDIYCPDDINNIKFCDDCCKKICPICGTMHYHSDNEYHLCSEECKKDAVIFPGQKRVISKVDFLSKSEKQIIIFARNAGIYDTIIDFCYNIEKNNKMSVNEVKQMIINTLICQYDFIYGRDFYIKIIPKILIEKHIIVGNQIESFGISYRDRKEMTFRIPDINVVNMLTFNNFYKSWSKKAYNFLQDVCQIENLYYYYSERRF